MKNFEVALLYKFLVSPVADSLVLTLKGNVAVQRNIRQLKDFFESVSAVEKKQKSPSESYQEFEQKRNELIQKFASRDEKGEVIQVSGGVRLDNIQEFNKLLEELMINYKDSIDEHTDKLKEWEEYANSECDLQVTKISEEDVKSAELSKKDFQAFSVMLIDSEESNSEE